MTMQFEDNREELLGDLFTKKDKSTTSIPAITTKNETLKSKFFRLEKLKNKNLLSGGMWQPSNI